jgi:hypothetical protein
MDQLDRHPDCRATAGGERIERASGYRAVCSGRVYGVDSRAGSHANGSEERANYLCVSAERCCDNADERCGGAVLGWCFAGGR